MTNAVPVRIQGTEEPSEAPALLEVSHLHKVYTLRPGRLRRPPVELKAVSDVSFRVWPGEIVGLVGESGSGKTTLGRCLLRLVEPTAGRIRFDRSDVTDLNEKDLRLLRQRMQIVFQDPYDSLNERMTVGQLVGEALDIHALGKRSERWQRILELLNQVGLAPSHADHSPRDLSGGQRQRVSIARALAVDPDFLVADEPVSALDLSIQAQILNLFQDLRDRLRLTMLFISHDLSVVRHISDRVMVMYLGRVVEVAPADELYQRPLHPYTQALLSAVPKVDPRGASNRIRLKGELPSAIRPLSGCVFRTRCPMATRICAEVVPEPREVDEHHVVSCHHGLNA